MSAFKMEGDERLNGPRDPKIIIVGAGISGIAAGNKLSEHGFTNFKILEASDRIGGRIWSVVMDEDGNKTEMGANWIHGIERNPIYQIADENHLLQLRHKDRTFRRKDLYLSEDGEVISERLVKEVDFTYGMLISACEEFFLNHVPAMEGDSVGDFLDRNFEEKLENYANGDRRLREILFGHHKRLECCISGCDDLQEVSLAEFGSYESLPGIHYTIPPGFDTILNILRKSIPEENIVLNSPVRCINWDLGPGMLYPACVEMENGEKHYANHVIVTVSLGVLKAAYERMFSPPLPTDKHHAITSMGYGIVDKVFLEFEKPIVDADVFRINIMWDNSNVSSDLAHSWYRKIYSFEVVHERILVGWMSGKEALYMESLTEEQIGADCVGVLKTMLKKEIPSPKRVIRTKWGTNPLTRGSYSFVAVGSTQQDVIALGAPLTGRGANKPTLLFAGEATHPTFYSTTHGALLTGYREANRLIKMYEPGAAEDPIHNEEDEDDNDMGISIL